MCHINSYQRNANWNCTNILLGVYENGLNQKNDKNQLLETMQTNWNSHILLVGMQNGIAILESKFLVYYKLYHTTQQSDSLVFTPKTCVWMIIAAFLSKSQKLKASQMSTTWWIDKQIVTYPYNGMLLNIKNEWITDTTKWMILMCIMLIED